MFGDCVQGQLFSLSTSELAFEPKFDVGSQRLLHYVNPGTVQHPMKPGLGGLVDYSQHPGDSDLNGLQADIV